jgi:hypothetical protein
MLNMNVKTLTLSLLILVFTSSCSGTYHAYHQTLKIVFSEDKDAEMTLIKIKQSKSDIISIKRGERSNAIMALAYIENGKHKWVSSDNAMLIMEKGRIVRTLGLDDNLLYLSNTDIDPLKSLPDLITSESKQKSITWLRAADRTGDEYSYPVESVFNQATEDTIQILNFNLATTLYVETVSYQAPSNYLQFDKSWKNYFWYTKDGELIKSIQKVTPISETLEITYLSRVARLNQ